MGLAGAIIVLAQVLSSFQSTTNLKLEMDQIKSDFLKVRKDQLNYYVKNEEKLNSLGSQLHKITNQIKSMGKSDGIIGCAIKTPLFLVKGD